jgi:hypothetical protein
LDVAEQAANRGDYNTASQILQQFDRELNNAIEEAVEQSVKGPWTEWREEEIRERDDQFGCLKARARELSNHFPPSLAQV